MAEMIFADTSFFTAIFNRTDDHHAQAVDHFSSLAGSIVTSEFVLIELGNMLSRTPARAKFKPFIERLRKDERFVILGSTDVSFDDALRLHHERVDKGWSMTDCTSFVIACERRISQALTADHHFEQAGLAILLK